ncbi:hypothetical protein AHAS_Ahas17G0088800 [Arachis hypogaea]
MSASSFLPNYTHTLMSVTQWSRWCHSSVSNGFLRTEWFAGIDMDSLPLWQHNSYQLTCIAILSGEYSTMTGAGFMTNGYNNGRLLELVHWIIRVYLRLSDVIPQHPPQQPPQYPPQQPIQHLP